MLMFMLEAELCPQSLTSSLTCQRMTLLLGPPSSGKTTLLLALAGQLGSGLQISGNITYNGHSLKEFVPQRTSAYVSQQDWHAAEMTVRETLEFAGRCQGVGIKYDMLMELSRREKDVGIKPDEDLDIFMKALAMEGKQTSLVVEYILKELIKKYVAAQACHMHSRRGTSNARWSYNEVYTNSTVLNMLRGG